MRRFSIDSLGRRIDLATGQPVMPLRVRGVGANRSGTGIPANGRQPGLGDYLPNGTGGPSNNMWPYDEARPWLNPPPLPAGSPGAPAPVQSAGGASELSAFASVPINASTSGATPIVTTNYKRNFILIQNNSTATTPDTTPIFYVTFDSPLQGAAGLALAVPALSGIVLDAVVPSNAIYITLGTYSNGGGTANVAGVLIQGTMLPAG